MPIPLHCQVNGKKNLTAKQSIKHIKTIWLWNTMKEVRLSDILKKRVKSRTVFSWTVILKFVITIWKKISKEMFWSASGTILDISGLSILFTMITARRRNIFSSTKWPNCKKRYYTTGMRLWQGLMREARNKAWRNYTFFAKIRLFSWFPAKVCYV